MRTDLKIAEEFFAMLTKRGVRVEKELIDSGKQVSFKINDFCDPRAEVCEISFLDGDYWRIDGAVYGGAMGGAYKNKIHVVGWKS